MQNYKKRATRVRSKIKSVSNRARLSVTRSNKNIWAQVIDDTQHVTVASASDKSLKAKGTKIEKAALVGQSIAVLALKNGVKEVVFDRGAFRYHGRIKALAEAARKAGLQF